MFDAISPLVLFANLGLGGVLARSLSLTFLLISRAEQNPATPIVDATPPRESGEGRNARLRRNQPRAKQFAPEQAWMHAQERRRQGAFSGDRNEQAGSQRRRFEGAIGGNRDEQDRAKRWRKQGARGDNRDLEDRAKRQREGGAFGDSRDGSRRAEARKLAGEQARRESPVAISRAFWARALAAAFSRSSLLVLAATEAPFVAPVGNESRGSGGTCPPPCRTWGLSKRW